jgi:hypothetical protein
MLLRHSIASNTTTIKTFFLFIWMSKLIGTRLYNSYISTRHQGLTVGRNVTLTLDWTIMFLRDIYGDLAFQVGGGLEYLHRSPASRKRRRRGNPVPGGITGGYKHRNLALKVGEISDETVKYGYGSYVIRTIERLHCKLQNCPLVREGSAQKQDRNFHIATFRQDIISGRQVPE